MKPPHTTKRASIAAGLVAVVLVSWLAYSDQQNVSPGDLAAAHAQDPRLLKPGGCVSCHGDLKQTSTSPCLTCHADVGSQLSSQKGVHGHAPAKLRGDCAKCHSEHHGKSFRLVSERSFALAGIPDPNHFDHAGLDYRLAGKHLRLACKQCHRWAEVDVLPKGKKRFLGLTQQCASCHQDVHKGRYGSDCASCHGQEKPFAQAPEFKHTRAFPLAGPHAGIACAKCHPRDGQQSVAALLAAARRAGNAPPAVRICADCHPSPHNATFLARIARELRVVPSRTCEHCHSADRATFVGSDAAMTRQEHAATGFPLDPPHDRAACVKCHAGYGRSKAPGRWFDVAYPGRGPDQCQACHVDPHRGQFEDGPFGGRGCLVCHDRGAFQPSAFTVGQHRATGFPLTGSHLGVACNDCHMTVDMPASAVGGAGKMRIFAGTPVSCEACHADIHDGIFDRPKLPQVVHGFRNCARCHGTERFDLLRVKFDHAAWTGYALEGAHARASCKDCHSPPQGPDGQGKTFAKAAGTRCEDCHRDPHAGQFRSPWKTDCSRCHTVNGTFKDSVFNHQTQSRFPLDNDHIRVPCAKCHRAYQMPGGGTVVRYKPLGIVCGDCHAVPKSGTKSERNRR